MEQSRQLEDLVGLLTRSLVDDPEAVSVSSEENGSRVDIEVRVAKDDMGRIIGRQGRTVRAIRTVAKAASVRLGKRVSVEVVD
ncbi:putative RNA-binding protein (contains KH domain) [Rubrobacter radiotolerans]|uniref:RNA-binding protein KhpA n=1 Tax=Rubrobacter radiotolerans TaxID=42256 RepID=A0A023X2X0_RUBRA|nr:KH domain-containing protein [Rubrobacter radiotolerans]AHY46678.1 putative RNA-binding protein (contains KH domain) [Rubrobacter radiotolerans]MDX5894085.1 KH domain-containing protein [Rubrobacter radiotolerans]SMC05159.1 RNA-binding protein (KH domain) [Rubrobacter radiotolerans DSM 5868]